MAEVSFKNADGSASNTGVETDTSGNDVQARIEEARARLGVSLAVGSHVDLSDGPQGLVKDVEAFVKEVQEEVSVG